MTGISPNRLLGNLIWLMWLAHVNLNSVREKDRQGVRGREAGGNLFIDFPLITWCVKLTSGSVCLNLLWLVEQLEHTPNIPELLPERPPTPLGHVRPTTTLVAPVRRALQSRNLLPRWSQAIGKWVNDIGSIGSIYTCTASLISRSARTYA